MPAVNTFSESGNTLDQRISALASQQQLLIYKRADRLFAGLMLFQWIAGIAAALWISPLAWAGSESWIHLHVWAAFCLGGAITAFPVYLALTQPGRASTRHIIAIGQMLTSALLIDLTGGRIETHFHVFGSLAFLAFYRDWRVLVSATVVVAIDHFVRGIYWPQSVYGVLTASPWRWLEHAGWVLFEDVFLIAFCRQGVRDLQQMAERQVRLEMMNETIEATVLDLKVSEARKAAILELAPDAIITMDHEGKILEFNPAAERIFGCSRGEMIGQELAPLLPAAGPDERWPGLKRYLAADERPAINQRIEIAGVRAGGAEFPVELAVIPILGGQQPVFTATMRDITERKQSEAVLLNAKTAAEEANRAKSQFLANMSHELRTPMNAILGFSEILQDQTFGTLNPKQTRYVDNILTSGRHLLELINSILDLSKVEAGCMELDRSHFDAAAALHSLKSIVKPLAAKKQIVLTTTIQEPIPLISADEAKFKQILYNLLSNAIKFTPEGGQVTASIEWREPWLQISVSDTGIGIQPEDQERIFRQFEQVDSSYARQQQGTGLGLSLTRQFVELHGGRLWVQSDGEGKGSTFSFVLPAPPAATGAPEPAVGTAVVTAGPGPVSGDGAATTPLVLVVEDDSQASELLTHYLSEAGYAVAQAFDGQRSVEMAKELRPCAITLDIMLPEKDGLQVLAELKADPETRDIPVVIVSITQERPSAFRLGAVDYLEKPVDRERLLEVVRCARAANGKSDTMVLVVYDEPAAVGRLTSALETHGFQVLPTGDCRHGTDLARETPPQVVVLDLRWPDAPAVPGDAPGAALSPRTEPSLV
jgi:two-component system sensor histidine kinase/response regulator